MEVTLNLNNGTYSPYRKPNNKMLQINNLSNYPPHTIKHLPTSINQRLSKNSSKEEIFNKSKANYEKALKDSGFQSTKLNYKYIKKN